MDTFWKVKLKLTSKTESWPTSHGSLTFSYFCRVFLRLSHFLRNYKGWSHETWIMHTPGRMKLKATINNESWHTFYGSWTRQLFCRVFFLHLDQFLRNYESWNLNNWYILKIKAETHHQYWILTYFSGLTDFTNFCRVFGFRSFSQKL